MNKKPEEDANIPNIFEGVLATSLFMVVFFSGFAAFGSYIMARKDSVLEAIAVVSDVRDVDQIVGDGKISSVSYVLTADLKFQKWPDENSPQIRPGDTIKILYDLDNPTGGGTFLKNARSPSTMMGVARIAGGIFLAAFLALMLLSRRNKPSRKPLY
jgi:cytochrome c oxidase assembly protein Cox11